MDVENLEEKSHWSIYFLIDKIIDIFVCIKEYWIVFGLDFLLVDFLYPQVRSFLSLIIKSVMWSHWSTWVCVGVSMLTHIFSLAKNQKIWEFFKFFCKPRIIDVYSFVFMEKARGFDVSHIALKAYKFVIFSHFYSIFEPIGIRLRCWHFWVFALFF